MTLEELEAAYQLMAADLAEFKDQTPSLEDLVFANTICCWTNSTQTPIRDITGAVWMTLMTAPIPLRVESVTLSWEYWNLTASDTSYWDAALAVRGPSTSFNYMEVAARTTQNTGANANGAVVARRAWSFDSAAWAPADLQVGDSLMLKPEPVGSPASNWRLPMTATIRYAAL